MTDRLTRDTEKGDDVVTLRPNTAKLPRLCQPKPIAPRCPELGASRQPREGASRRDQFCQTKPIGPGPKRAISISQPTIYGTPDRQRVASKQSQFPANGPEPARAGHGRLGPCRRSEMRQTKPIGPGFKRAVSILQTRIYDTPGRQKLVTKQSQFPAVPGGTGPGNGEKGVVQTNPIPIPGRPALSLWRKSRAVIE
jgi:hypothetical protein